MGPRDPWWGMVQGRISHCVVKPVIRLFQAVQAEKPGLIDVIVF